LPVAGKAEITPYHASLCMGRNEPDLGNASVGKRPTQYDKKLQAALPIQVKRPFFISLRLLFDLRVNQEAL